MQLFDKMLESEKALPFRLAFDKPSEKLLGFMRKHYGLISYKRQNNNFLIFDQYFETE
jgi:alpha-tubulin N-acetyltransferase 1